MKPQMIISSMIYSTLFLEEIYVHYTSPLNNGSERSENTVEAHAVDLKRR